MLALGSSPTPRTYADPARGTFGDEDVENRSGLALVASRTGALWWWVNGLSVLLWLLGCPLAWSVISVKSQRVVGTASSVCAVGQDRTGCRPGHLGF